MKALTSQLGRAKKGTLVRRKELLWCCDWWPVPLLLKCQILKNVIHQLLQRTCCCFVKSSCWTAQCSGATVPQALTAPTVQRALSLPLGSESRPNWSCAGKECGLWRSAAKPRTIPRPPKVPCFFGWFYVRKNLQKTFLWGSWYIDGNPTTVDGPDAQVTGGRNGYGAKLTNIFSTKFAPGLNLSKNRALWWNPDMFTLRLEKVKCSLWIDLVANIPTKFTRAAASGSKHWFPCFTCLEQAKL